MRAMTKMIGLISDTHGLIRPEALNALRGSDFIIHAGDIGRPDVLGHLMALAPVFAVRGNVDNGVWAASLPETENLTIGGHRVLVLHALSDLAVNPESNGIAAIIHGHTHQPLVEEKGGVLYVNPGSAGPRRFRLPVTVGTLHVTDGKLKAGIIDLKV
jgi:putative phosphoesterase